MRVRICEKRGIDDDTGDPLYVVASLGASTAQSVASDYYVRIEEHGIEPWGDQRSLLYDWTGFLSKVYDVSFTEDCNTAVLFVHDLDGTDGTANPGVGPERVFIKLDLTKSQNIEDAVVIRKQKEYNNDIVYTDGLIDPKDDNFYLLSGK